MDEWVKHKTSTQETGVCVLNPVLFLHFILSFVFCLICSLISFRQHNYLVRFRQHNYLVRFRQHNYLVRFRQHNYLVRFRQHNYLVRFRQHNYLVRFRQHNYLVRFRQHKTTWLGLDNTEGKTSTNVLVSAVNKQCHL